MLTINRFSKSIHDICSSAAQHGVSVHHAVQLQEIQQKLHFLRVHLLQTYLQFRHTFVKCYMEILCTGWLLVLLYCVSSSINHCCCILINLIHQLELLVSCCKFCLADNALCSVSWLWRTIFTIFTKHLHLTVWFCFILEYLLQFAERIFL